MRYIGALSIALSVYCASCNKTQQAFTDTPIIECYLNAGDSLSMLVTRQIPFIDDPDYLNIDIENLAISIQRNGVTYIPASLGDGRYSIADIEIMSGDSFNFYFDYGGLPVLGYTIVPSKPIEFTASEFEMEIERLDSTTMPQPGMEMPDPIDLTWSNDDNSYYLIVVENTESELEPIRDFGDAEPPGSLFRKSPTNSGSDRLSPMDFQYYGTHRVILYHVQADYAALYNESTSSSQNLSNPSTSIEYGYGIFTGMNADTLYVEINEY